MISMQIKLIILILVSCQKNVVSIAENSTNSKLVQHQNLIIKSSNAIKANTYENSSISTLHPVSLKKSVKFVNKGSTKKRQKEYVDISSILIDNDSTDWRCPNITGSRSLECACDLPHTLRCNGDVHGITSLAEHLRTTPYSVALLDVSLRNVTFLSDARIFDGTSLRCLIISSGEIKRVHKSAFLGIKGPLLALGLPANALLSVPWSSISTLVGLERLDLSNNKIKALGTSDLATLVNLEYLDLSNNQVSSISQRAFINLRKLEILKLGGNRLGDYAFSLKALTQCLNLRELDISANNINGPLTTSTLPILKNLESLNLNRNLVKSIQNKALINFSRLLTLTLRHNQIDVLQDHAFYGLGFLETLDLSYNGIVAISGASLQHLVRLTTLDLTHNFLRALTSDLITPLPSLTDLRLSGNDISIVARNALNGAKELKSISMHENPLSCDCTIHEFAEWLQTQNLVSEDLLSITCATPPKLEGAPLIQVPVEMLNCDIGNVEKDNENIIEQLENFAKKNHSKHHINYLSDEIVLEELHFSADYGLILSWIINLSKTDYMCDAIFVYKEENINEILIDNSPIHCESKIINGKNTVSVIVPDSSALEIGESIPTKYTAINPKEYTAIDNLKIKHVVHKMSCEGLYRFCLVMVEEYNPHSDIRVGCSNITQLQISKSSSLSKSSRPFKLRPYADLSMFDRPIEKDQKNVNDLSTEFVNNGRVFKFNAINQEDDKNDYAKINFDFLNSLNKSFLPGIGLGILVTSLLVLIWGALRLKYGSKSTNIHNSNNNSISRSSSSTATTCYTAQEHIAQLTDSESRTRYLKLQATTSL